MSPLEITIGVYTIRKILSATIIYKDVQHKLTTNNLNNFFIQFWFKYCNHMNDIEMTAL